MASLDISIHHRFVPDYGPASNFVPPNLDVQEDADAGGGQPTVPNALVFIDPADAKTHVFILAEEMRQQLVKMLTGGIVLPGGGT